MRHTASVTSISWIPSEAVTGVTKLPFLLNVAHWDDPLPDRVSDLEGLRAASRFRFANELRAWIDIDEDGRITDAGYSGDGHVGITKITVAGVRAAVPGVAFPDLRHEPVRHDNSVRFVQTAGGRLGMPYPRKVNRPPFAQFWMPPAWTTLALTLHADGTAEHEVVGASPFPRHWIYDGSGRLVEKSGLVNYQSWSATNFGDRTPWGEHDEKALVAEVETVLERELSTLIMRAGAKPRIRKIRKGEMLTEQGAPGEELYLVLDGMLTVEVDGEAVAEVGPGAILGERAVLEGGRRTSTLRAATPCKVAVAGSAEVKREALAELAQHHRREEELRAEDLLPQDAASQ
ncbi:MAG: cyclic nucleotide-binding domain-containing protein [Egibacteraceae bacterium]